jgi:hypothetical protein
MDQDKISANQAMVEAHFGSEVAGRVEAALDLYTDDMVIANIPLTPDPAREGYALKNISIAASPLWISWAIPKRCTRRGDATAWPMPCSWHFTSGRLQMTC